MDADAVVKTIQSVIAPTVMITGCTLIQNTVLARYSGVGDRLRALVRERLTLLEEHDVADPIIADAIALIDMQLSTLVRRYSLLRTIALLLYAAMGCFLLAMFAIALAREVQALMFSYGAVVLFLFGTATLLLGVFLAASEVRISHRAVRAEVRWALSITDESHPIHP